MCPKFSSARSPSLALVARDDAGLVAAADRDRFGERVGVARVQRVGVRFEPGEEIRIADRAVLDDFGEAGARIRARGSVASVAVSMTTARG